MQTQTQSHNHHASGYTVNTLWKRDVNIEIFTWTGVDEDEDERKVV